jgi:hypothetical protein
MTRTPHDQFAKHCFEPLLSSIGEFTPAKPVSAEVREIDVYFGVFFAPKDWHTGFIVVHKLPKTPDTLWFRLFGSGDFQTQAFIELAQLPFEHPYRNSLMDSLANLKVILEV